MRYKATIILKAPAIKHGAIPSATGILGSYGDVVNLGDDTYYVSWYPRSKMGQRLDGDVDGLLRQMHSKPLQRSMRNITRAFPWLSSAVASQAHKRFIRKSLRDISAYVPSLEELLLNHTSFRVGGGIILARGTTDIDDPASTLHQRSAIGPKACGAYVSVDTGKYCMAPLFAIQAADMLINQADDSQI